MAVLQVFFRCNKRGDGVAAKSSQADKYDCLRLENQLCFPQLAGLDLTYTQYIAMMVLWEHKSVTVSELGNKLYLDSGTLTPLLKKLEQKGFVTRCRCQEDERSVCVKITEAGEELKEKALEVPGKMCSCVGLSDEEKMCLERILKKIMGRF